MELLGDGQRGYRLNPQVAIERVDWAKLEEVHPDECVKRLAREMMKATSTKPRA